MREALHDLLGAADACAGQPLPWRELVDFDVACREARRFKLDASFALDRGGRAVGRFSVNDKGEPVAFRERLLRFAPVLERQLGVSPPGEVQTTLAVKSNGVTTLYFEELAACPRAEELRQQTFALAGAAAPPLPEGAAPVAVCLDWVGAEIAAAKTYAMVTERAGETPRALPREAAAYRELFEPHPVHGTRRYLLATRHAPGGAPRGSKLLWMSEVHRPVDVGWAWAAVARARARVAAPASAVSRALDGLVSGWSHAPDTLLYPDLVSLDLDAAGRATGLVVYVSVR